MSQLRGAVDQRFHLSFEFGHALFEIGDLLAFRIRQVPMFQHSSRHVPHLYHSSRNAHYGRIIGHRMHHHRAGSDLDMVTDLNPAQHFRAGSNDHVVSNRRMPLAALVAGTAQRYALIHQHVVANFRRFANDDSHAVVDEEAPADGRAGMNFDARQESR